MAKYGEVYSDSRGVKVMVVADDWPSEGITRMIVVNRASSDIDLYLPLLILKSAMSRSDEWPNEWHCISEEDE